MAGAHRAKPLPTRGRSQSRRLLPYTWLGAGAVALGVGAALTGGTAPAHADSGGESSQTHGESRQSRASRDTAERPSQTRSADDGAGSNSDDRSTDDERPLATGNKTRLSKTTRESSSGEARFADAVSEEAHTGAETPASTETSGLEVRPGDAATDNPDDTAVRAAALAPAARTPSTQDDGTPDAQRTAHVHSGALPAAEGNRASAAGSSLGALFRNQTPTVSWTQASPTGSSVVTGVLTASDPDGDALSYKVTRNPAYGAVTVYADGSVAYTPHQNVATSIDSFRVTVSDAASGFHVHGLSGLINLFSFGLLGKSGHEHTITAEVRFAATAVPQPTVLDRIVLPLNAGQSPRTVAVSPDGRLVFVGSGRWNSPCCGFDNPDGALSVIDAASGAVLSTVKTGLTPISFAVGSTGLLYAVGVDGGTGYTNYFLSAMTPNDYLTKSTFTDTRAIPDLYMQPISLAVTPDGNSVVIGGRNGQVAVVDPMTTRVIRTFDIGFGNHAEGVYVTPDGKYAWISGGYYQPLFRLDLSTGAIGQVQIDYGAGGVLSPDGSKFYTVVDRHDYGQRIEIVDTATGAISSYDYRSESVHRNLIDLAVSPDGKHLYARIAASQTSNRLDVIDAATGVVVAQTQVGSEAALLGLPGMAISPEGNRIYLATGDSITVVRANSTDRPLLPRAFPSASASALLLNLPRQTDTIYAEKVMRDGKTRMIVYMTGIDAGLNESTLASIISNSGLLHADVEAYIDNAYTAWGGARVIEEIQLVGHSNGGQQMQAYADWGTYADKVTSVVLFGAPIIKTEDEFTSDALAFINRGDPVPTIFSHWENPGVRWNSMNKDINFYGPESSDALNFERHHASSYYAAAVDFDAKAGLSSAPATQRRLRDTLLRFGGYPVDAMPTAHIAVFTSVTRV
ncbi:hypothetical protein KUF57_23380 [Mycolicibacterium sp. PAM1]|uniref:Uncharacterized conserved protein n=2 Tax=Mycolicibacterium gilvum TaxID=1804 RepID=E6THN7_MYCSR|nr:conserved hypothetical protein [Mycolicibacterium gilvum PYR-GCK]ADT96786.1 uncharacterized conserved protein [Mycolicibacterium gilvum Spyr1]MBV5246483.1 hypothetical protein [Mycolicibacterium sp. PAM1]